MNDLQNVYDRLIRYANVNFAQSKEDIFKDFHDILLAKSEAWEAAADLLWNNFPNDIVTVHTLRWCEKTEVLNEEVKHSEKIDG